MLYCVKAEQITAIREAEANYYRMLKRVDDALADTTKVGLDWKAMQRMCDHRYSDGTRAYTDELPYSTCSICGEILIK